MRSYLLERVETLLKTHPNVVIFVLTCSVATLSVGWVMADETFAKKQELEQKYEDLKEQITVVQEKVSSIEQAVDASQKQSAINALVQRVADVDAEIYQLQRLVDDEEANDRDRERLVQLRSEQVELTRQLNALYSQ